MDRFTTLLSSAELAVQDLYKKEKLCRENVDQLTEEQWQLQLAQLRLQKEQVKASANLVEQQLGPVQRRLKQIRRARKLRRKNRALHKQLVKAADDEHNRRVQLTFKQQTEKEKARREQFELDQLDREDANCMLNEILRKKKDLIAFHQKLKESIINRLVQYNKEENYIKQVFNKATTCQVEKTTLDQEAQQQATLKKLLKKHPDQWQSALIDKILHKEEFGPAAEFDSIPAEWSKYVSATWSIGITTQLLSTAKPGTIFGFWLQ
ncbi:hypothetical protein TYRP_007452 [Tyrophagus putrescentiae]|nr:hypothetical protein TYRP_007452 [Tyrophagus putrescentiae]